jgi:hypothetical protein
MREIDVVVFGSNGGGDHYALAITDGPIYRLREFSYEAGVYRGPERGITVVGEDLRDFLEIFWQSSMPSPKKAASPISSQHRHANQGQTASLPVPIPPSSSAAIVARRRSLVGHLA